MSIKEKIEKTLDKNKKLVTDDPQKLSEFIAKLQKEGLVIKKQYDFPPLDTVGRQFYQNTPLFPEQTL